MLTILLEMKLFMGQTPVLFEFLLTVTKNLPIVATEMAYFASLFKKVVVQKQKSYKLNLKPKFDPLTVIYTNSSWRFHVK